MLLQETFYATKDFFYKTFQSLKSCFLERFQKLPKTPLANPIILPKNPKLQELDSFCKDFSDKNEIQKIKVCRLSPEKEMEGDENFNRSSMNLADQRGLKESKKEKTEKSSEGKHVESIFQNAEAIAKKMKELEMMEVNNVDHVLDIEEVLHYYSRLTSPAYQDIVDKFFMDMYAEYYLPPPSASVHSSMGKLGSVSVRSSMRSLGPLKL